MTVHVREGREYEDDEVNLLDCWRVLTKRRKLVLGLAVLPALLTGIYCYFFATKIYESTAAVLAPKETGSGATAGLAAALAAFISVLVTTILCANLPRFLPLEDMDMQRFDPRLVAAIRMRPLAADRFGCQPRLRHGLVDGDSRDKTATPLSVLPIKLIGHVTLQCDQQKCAETALLLRR